MVFVVDIVNVKAIRADDIRVMLSGIITYSFLSYL